MHTITFVTYTICFTYMYIIDMVQGRRRWGARASPLSKGGGHKWVCAPPPPTFGQSKCSNFTICSYFVVKNTIFFKIFLARFARQL